MRYSRLPEAPGSFGETALVTDLPFGLAMGFLWVLCCSLLRETFDPVREFGSPVDSEWFGTEVYQVMKKRRS